MFLLWYCELKKPLVLETIEEVRAYVSMMRACNQGTPRWEQVPPEYFEGVGI